MSKFFNKKIASAGQQSGKNNKSSILFYWLALLAAFKGIQWLVEVIPKNNRVDISKSVGGVWCEKEVRC